MIMLGKIHFSKFALKIEITTNTKNFIFMFVIFHCYFGMMILLGVRSWMQGLVNRSIQIAKEGKLQHEPQFNKWNELAVTVSGPAITLKLGKTNIRYFWLFGLKC
jgi:hypothetical protein